MTPNLFHSLLVGFIIYVNYAHPRFQFSHIIITNLSLLEWEPRWRIFLGHQVLSLVWFWGCHSSFLQQAQLLSWFHQQISLILLPFGNSRFFIYFGLILLHAVKFLKYIFMINCFSCIWSLFLDATIYWIIIILTWLKCLPYWHRFP